MEINEAIPQPKPAYIPVKSEFLKHGIFVMSVPNSIICNHNTTLYLCILYNQFESHNHLITTKQIDGRS
ncbi:hypothetical protein DERF_010950 [Dermatophagoides farinae]|uniref:Uncharacterized protein n=1 Tax=Dermatophagoides farinae TaxID=6954 RepID=A0A922HRB1_DERFA|nr:hypothetical protein DERF_010950 [Dermatophagoides farinae]